MSTKVTVIPGDGIGPEIMNEVLKILEKAKAPLQYVEAHAGELAYEKTGELLPDQTLQSIKENKIALKSPITTPVGKGFRSLNVTLRQTFDLYANVRPVKNLPGAPCKYENIDLVIVQITSRVFLPGITS